MKDDSCLWEKKIMKKGKRHWGFTCGQCKEKISSKNHTEYYLLRWEYFVNFRLPTNGDGDGELDDIYARFCSKDCLLNHLKESGYDIEETVQAIHDALEIIEQRRKADEEKERCYYAQKKPK